jgi:hypothetical protein
VDETFARARERSGETVSESAKRRARRAETGETGAASESAARRARRAVTVETDAAGGWALEEGKCGARVRQLVRRVCVP